MEERNHQCTYLACRFGGKIRRNTCSIFTNLDEEYSSAKNLVSDWGYNDETLYIHALEINTKIFIQYLDRKITFVVVNHEGENYLKVVSSENSSLKINDLLFVYKIRKGEILEAEKVIRGDSIGNYKTHGEIINVELLKD